LLLLYSARRERISFEVGVRRVILSMSGVGLLRRKTGDALDEPSGGSTASPARPAASLRPMCKTASAWPRPSARIAYISGMRGVAGAGGKSHGVNELAAILQVDAAVGLKSVLEAWATSSAASGAGGANET
jgi:hypothetical protein